MDLELIKSFCTSKHSLSRNALLVLLYLKDIKKYTETQTELADTLGINRTTLSESLTSLKLNNFIKVIPQRKNKSKRTIEYIGGKNE